MLPFLKNKNTSVAGLIIKSRKPDEKPDEVAPESDITQCAQDLIDAVHAKDVAAVSSALETAFSILEAKEEAEPVSPHTYEAQDE